MNPDVITSVFEERAENLSASELRDWSTDTSHDRTLIRSLAAPGAKLLSGPRGCGKSTLLRRTYFNLIRDHTALPIYVNYSRSLALEPLFHTHANALQLFRQWVLAKIVQGASTAFLDANKPPPRDLIELSLHADMVVNALGAGTEPNLAKFLLSPPKLLNLLDTWSGAFDTKRTVLLLDDAAHAFSHEQQRDFFEVFRELRSRTVSAKAAVYPGVTRYSPHFHVGHEAQVLEAWLDPLDPDYLNIMWSVVERRLPTDLVDMLSQNRDIADLLALASFGIPRGFLLMLSTVLGLDDQDTATTKHRRPTRRLALTTVQQHSDTIRGIFKALARKLPRFKNFVEVGGELDRAAIASVRRFNHNRTRRQKTPTVALPEPIVQPLDRIIGLLEYAGIFRKRRTVSRGVKGVFQRFDIHYALLINDNALSLGKSFTAQDIVDALEAPPSHAFVRSKPETLLGRDYAERCSLDLQPCTKCGTPRTSPDARFCTQCGAPLPAISIYDSLLHASVDQLPLTAKKITDLRDAGIETVQDILLDDEMTKIRSISYIGEVWAARIRTAADEFVSV